MRNAIICFVWWLSLLFAFAQQPVDMNGNFASIHCLRPGRYDFRLPFPCRVVNLKSGAEEQVVDGAVPLVLTAGETCWFRFEEKGKMP